MKSKVIVFPGSNCDLDAYHLLKDVLNYRVEYIYFNQKKINNCDLIILPGGFTYGDYLRSGAIARFSPVMDAVIDFAERGGLVLGICNGFQVLTEAGLLPGALYRNNHLHFRCEKIYLRIENNSSPYTMAARKGDILKIPVAHGDGNYYADPKTLEKMERNNQILFRYCDSEGNISNEANPNGSLSNIAGICNKKGNVAGMMPHPERAGETLLGSTDGLVIFRSIFKSLEKGRIER